MSFRFFQPGTQFFSNDGQVLAGGSLSFFENGTTTPKDTYSDPTLTTPNPNPVPLDGAGRPENDIWGDGSYRVVLKDAGGVTLVTLNDVSGPQGIPDPSLQAGTFLTNDGTDLEWESILQVPDPTGSANGDVLTTHSMIRSMGNCVSAQPRAHRHQTAILHSWGTQGFRCLRRKSSRTVNSPILKVRSIPYRSASPRTLSSCCYSIRPHRRRRSRSLSMPRARRENGATWCSMKMSRRQC